jgi:signal transduction histidine kinase
LAAIDRTQQGAVRESVPWSRDDEIGAVIRAFNGLQERQAAYEAALDDARATLEQRVEDRTAELVKARDEAEGANIAKSVFLANMSHELRTPLNSILGFAGILTEERFGAHTDARYKSYAEIIASSGDHLLDLINDLLDLSKAESGTLILEDVPVSIADQAHRAVDMLQGFAETNKVTLLNRVDPSLPAIRADTRRIRQIITNLLSNAIKFTPRGGRVTLSNSIEGDGGVTVVVRDTGIGIPSGQINEVVRPFSQLEGGLTREHRGTGLGLALCKSMVEQHGGVLSIESELDRGTTVKVHFPALRTLNLAQGG